MWSTYLFAGMVLLQPFSPFIRMIGTHPFPKLPFDVSEFEKKGIRMPDDIKAATAYREFFEILEGYARIGLKELRVVNPVTRAKATRVDRAR